MLLLSEDDLQHQLSLNKFFRLMSYQRLDCSQFEKSALQVRPIIILLILLFSLTSRVEDIYG